LRNRRDRLLLISRRIAFAGPQNGDCLAAQERLMALLEDLKKTAEKVTGWAAVVSSSRRCDPREKRIRSGSRTENSVKLTKFKVGYT
jgi:hypothetical protein